MSFLSITTIILIIALFNLIHYGSVHAQSTIPLQNNQILYTNITSGAQQHYYFNTQGSSTATQNIKRTISYLKTTEPYTNHDNDNNVMDPSPVDTLMKRAPPTAISTMYLTLTSCTQPIPPPNYNGEIPSVDIYVSTVNSNKLPGPTNHQNNNTVDDTLPGRISWQGGTGLTELWIGVAAPTLTTGWTGEWTYELAISTTQWLHPLYQQNNSLTLEDTDSTHALFISADYTTGTNRPNMTTLITQNVPKELKYSYCAAKSHQVASYSVNVTDTTRGRINDNHLRQQIMVSNLTQGQVYQAYMVQEETSQGNRITGIATPLNIRTKSDPHCRMIYDLDFCSDVAYSVPTDPNQDIWNITRSYDEQAKELFSPFGTALTQFNCNSTQYSLVRNCDDCYRDYKRWLCAVTIPRCTSNADSPPISATPTNENQATPLPTVDTRDVTNGSSRNPWIDEKYQPSGWTELLPCIDVCYQVVQSCPPFLQFNCPEGDLASQQYGYWKTQINETRGTLFGINHPTCNRLNMNESLLVISDGGIRLSFSSSLLTACLALVLYTLYL